MIYYLIQDLNDYDFEFKQFSSSKNQSSAEYTQGNAGRQNLHKKSD